MTAATTHIKVYPRKPRGYRAVALARPRYPIRRSVRLRQQQTSAGAALRYGPHPGAARQSGVIDARHVVPPCKANGSLRLKPTLSDSARNGSFVPTAAYRRRPIQDLRRSAFRSQVQSVRFNVTACEFRDILNVSAPMHCPQKGCRTPISAPQGHRNIVWSVGSGLYGLRLTGTSPC